MPHILEFDSASLVLDKQMTSALNVGPLVFTLLVPFEVAKKDHLVMATEGSEGPEERGLSG